MIASAVLFVLSVAFVAVAFTRVARARAARTALAVAALAVVVHAGFVPLVQEGVWTHEALDYDDPQVIEAARESSVAALLTETTYFAYKPVYFLSLKADALFGADMVTVALLGNLVLHALAAALLVVLLFDVFGSRWIAGAAGVLFAVHPVHVESVAWLAERKDVLSLVLVLAAHLCWRRSRVHGPWALAAVALFLLGGLTKGTVWVWAGVIALDEWLWLRGRRAEGASGLHARLLVPLALVAVGGVVLDLVVGIHRGPAAVDHGAGTVSLAAAMSGVHLRYLAHVLVPSGLALDYAVDPAGSWASPLAWLGLASIALGVFLWVRAAARGAALAAWAGAIWFLGLLPVNNVFPRTSVLMADRYLYVPAIGAYLVVAALLARLPRHRGAVLATAAVLLGALALARTHVFRTPAAAWTDTIAKVPASALARVQRGRDAVTDERWGRALADADAALALDPVPAIAVRARLVRAAAHLGLGDTLRLLVAADEAIAALDRLDDDDFPRRDVDRLRAEAEIFRGKALEAQGRLLPALDAYGRAVQLDPHNGVARYNLASALASLGGADALEEATDHLREALGRLGRGSAHRLALVQLATVLAKRAGLEPERRGVLVEEALAALQRAESAYGRAPDLVYAEATIALDLRRDLSATKELLTELRRLDPDHPKGSRLQAEILLTEGRTVLEQREGAHAFKVAVERFDAAAAADPGWSEPHLAAGDAFFQRRLFAPARVRYRDARDVERGAAWIHRLVARTHVLEAALLAHEAEERPEDAESLERRAAEEAAAGLRLPVDRIDVGFWVLGEEELDLLRTVAARFEKGSPGERAFAAAVLRGAAALAAGRERIAAAEVRWVLEGAGLGAPHAAVRDGALMLRASVRAMRMQLEGAAEDWALLAGRRPDDVLPRLREAELALRVASAHLRTARATAPRGGRDGAIEPPPEVDAAQAEVAAALERVVAVADRWPSSLDAGLAAVEAEMHRARWDQALRRLNELAQRFPDRAAVHRGRAFVYLTQRVGSDREAGARLVRQAARELEKAMALDPRDPRTHLDAAQLHRRAQDVVGALRHARRAMALEIVPRGPARRMVAALHVALGRRALEAGRAEAVLEHVRRAREADPSSSAAWLLEAELAFATPQRDRASRALELARQALELEPLNPEVEAFLGKVYRHMGLAAFFRWSAVKPAAADTEEARAEAEKAKAAYRRAALRAFDAAAALAPEAEEQGDVSQYVDALRRADPAARRDAMRRAREELFPQGEARLADGDLLGALESFEEAVTLFPSFARAHARIVQVAWRVLPGWDRSVPKEAKRFEWIVDLAYTSLHVLDQLDVEGRLHERHLMRGLLDEHMWRLNGSEALRQAAINALEKFIALESEASDAERSHNLRMAEARLRSLRRGR